MKTIEHQRDEFALSRPARLAPLLLIVLLFACADRPQDADVQANEDRPQETPAGERVLASNLQRIVAYADSIEARLRPVPLLTNAQVAAFRRFRNADQLVAARRLGVSQPVTQDDIEEHLASGRLVRLEDSEYWTLRETEYGTPVVTPDVVALLTEIGDRFHSRLEEYDLPPLRLEVTSALRSAENQEALRRVNPNAALGESTHQYGTTVDVTYASFRAPLEPAVELQLEEASWLEPHLRRVEVLAAETGAARMSRELQAILGDVLREMQGEGKVMVTLEVLQPVYHMTVATDLASESE